MSANGLEKTKAKSLLSYWALMFSFFRLQESFWITMLGEGANTSGSAFQQICVLMPKGLEVPCFSLTEMCEVNGPKLNTYMYCIFLCCRDLNDIGCFIKVIDGCQQLDKETRYVRPLQGP